MILFYVLVEACCSILVEIRSVNVSERQLFGLNMLYYFIFIVVAVQVLVSVSLNIRISEDSSTVLYQDNISGLNLRFQTNVVKGFEVHLEVRFLEAVDTIFT